MFISKLFLSTPFRLHPFSTRDNGTGGFIRERLEVQEACMNVFQSNHYFYFLKEKKNGIKMLLATCLLNSNQNLVRCDRNNTTNFLFLQDF